MGHGCCQKKSATVGALQGQNSCQENMLQYGLSTGCSSWQENQLQHQLSMGHSSCQTNMLQHRLSMATVPVRKTCPSMGSPQSVVPSGHTHWFQGGVLHEPQSEYLLWRFPLHRLQGSLRSVTWGASSLSSFPNAGVRRAASHSFPPHASLPEWHFALC